MLDEISRALGVAVNDGLDLAVPLGRNDGADDAALQVGQDEIGVVFPVCEQDAGLGPGLVHDRGIAFHIGDLTTAQRDRDREAHSVVAEMDLGREATARAA